MHSSYRKRAMAWILAFLMVLTTAFSNSTIFVNATEDKNIRVTSIDDFESYTNDAALAKAWTAHKWGCDPVTPSLSDGKMKYDYELGDQGFVGLVKSASVKVSDYEGISLWYESDNSGNILGIQLSVGGTDYKYSTTLGATGGTINIPFKEFSDGSNSLSSGSVSSIGIYVNKEAKSGSSTLYFDNIGAYKTVTPVESVTLDKNDVTMEVGSTEKLSATVTPDDATNKTVTWSSSDDTIATVTDGTVSAKGIGTATITATADGVSAMCNVTVTGKAPIILDSFDAGISGWDGALGSNGDIAGVSYDNLNKALQVAVNYDGTADSEARIYKNYEEGVDLSARSYVGYQITYPESLDGKFAAKIYGSSAARTQTEEVDSSVDPATTTQAPATTQATTQAATTTQAPATTQATTEVPPATTQAPATTEAVVTGNGGMYINGSKLYTAGGQEVVMRGVNLAHVFYRDRSATDLQKISDLGANAVRIVLTNGAYAANGWQKDKNTPDDIRPLVDFCRQNGIVAVLDDQTTTGGDSQSYLDDAVNYWIGMKDFMNEYKDCVVLNIANEWSGKWVADNSNYVPAYQSAIKKLRDAGLENVIMVDAAGWGQDIMGLAGVAQSIFDADEDKNTMFSGHMYCYGAPDASGIKSRIDAFTNKNLCFCVGEFGWRHKGNNGAQDIDYKTIMSYAQQNCAGWLAWSWYGNGAEGNYLAEGDLDMVTADNSLKSPWGTDVAAEWKGAPRYSFSGTGTQATTSTQSTQATQSSQSTQSTQGGNDSNGGMYVSGSTLYDANGNAFTMRGVNINHAWYKDRTMDAIAKSGELGSNCARIVMSDGTCPNWTSSPESASSLEDIIKACRNSGQVAVVEIHDGTGFDDTKYIDSAVNYWIGVKDVLNKYKDSVIVNIANEWSGSWLSDNSAYTSTYQNAIKKLREAGIENVIMIDAPGWGQDIMGLASVASSIKAADSTGNTMFSGHMYCWGAPSQSGIKERIDAFMNNGLCFCVGEFGWQHKGSSGKQAIDYEYIMKYCQEVGSNWLAWSWYGNGAEGDYLAAGDLDLVDASNNLKSPYGTTVAAQWSGSKKISTLSSSTLSEEDMVAGLSTTSLVASALSSVSTTAVTQAQAVAKAAASGSIYVNGTKLYDADGNEFVMRGLNIAHQWYKDGTETSIKEAAALGSNTVRVVLTEGTQWTKTPASEVEQIINWCRQNNQICVVELHDFTGYNLPENITVNAVNYWTEIKSLLNANKDYVILNIANEWCGTWNQADVWTDTYVTAIKQLRSNGIENAIMVDASGYGNEVKVLADNCKTVLAADSMANTMFSFHVYSSFGNDVVAQGQSGTGTAIKAGIDAILEKGVCLTIGEFGYWQNGGEVDERTFVDYTAEKNIGWLAWSWYGNGGIDQPLDMTGKSFSAADLTEWGKWVFGTKNGIQETSKLAYSGKAYTGTKVSTSYDSLPTPEVTTTESGPVVTSDDTAGIPAGVLEELDWKTSHNVHNDLTEWKATTLTKLTNNGLRIDNIDLTTDKDATFYHYEADGMDLSSHKTIDLVVRNNNAAAIQLCLIMPGGEYRQDDGSVGPAWCETKSVDASQPQNGRAPYINIPAKKTVHVQFSISPEYLQVYNGGVAEEVIKDVKYLAFRVQMGTSGTINAPLDIISMGYDWDDTKYEDNIAELNRPKTIAKWTWDDPNLGNKAESTQTLDVDNGVLTINYSGIYQEGESESWGGVQAQTRPNSASTDGEDWSKYGSVTATLTNKGSDPMHVTFLCRNSSDWIWAENFGSSATRTDTEECIIAPGASETVTYSLTASTWKTKESNWECAAKLTNLDCVKALAWKIYTGQNEGPYSGTLEISNFSVNFGDGPADNTTQTPATTTKVPATTTSVTPVTTTTGVTPATTTQAPVVEAETFGVEGTIVNKVNNGDGTITAFVYAPVKDYAFTAKSLTLGFVGEKAYTGAIKVDNIQLCDELPAKTEPNENAGKTEATTQDEQADATTSCGVVTTEGSVTTTASEADATTGNAAATTASEADATTGNAATTTAGVADATTGNAATTTAGVADATTGNAATTTAGVADATTGNAATTTAGVADATTGNAATTTAGVADATTGNAATTTAGVADATTGNAATTTAGVADATTGNAATTTAGVADATTGNATTTAGVADATTGNAATTTAGVADATTGNAATTTAGVADATTGNAATTTAATPDATTGNASTTTAATPDTTTETPSENVAVESVELDKESIGLVVGGDTVTLNATVQPATATNQNVTWKTGNAKVATVENGVVTAVGEGNTFITVITEDGNFTAVCAVYVSKAGVAVTGVTFVDSNMVLLTGESAVAKIAIAPSDATNQNVTFGTSDETVVSVDATGKVTAVGQGDAYITVTTADGGFMAVLPVKVQSVISVEGVALTEQSVSLPVGSKKVLTYTITPASASNKAVEWFTSNQDVVRVTEDGELEAVAAGTATVRVTTVDGNFTALCSVEVTPAEVPVTSVAFAEDAITITEGTSKSLEYEVLPSSATNKAVTFESSAPEKVSVDINGKITAIGLGDAEITVKTVDGSYTDTIKVTVEKAQASEVEVTGITLSDTVISIVNGDSQLLTANVQPSEATNKKVTWRVVGDAVTVSDAGLVTAVKAGEATIYATTDDGSFTAKCDVYVTEKTIKVDGVTMTKPEVVVVEGETASVSAVVSPVDATNRAVEYSTSDPSVAVVDAQGNIIGIKAGTATITATTVDGSYTAATKVTVYAKNTTVAVNGIELSDSKVTVKVNETKTLTATVTPSDATNKEVEWNVSREDIVTVDNGVIKGVKAGTATVFATTVDGRITAICSVTVEEAATTTEKPDTTTQAPIVTTEQPAADNKTTQQPAGTTQAPAATTQQPSTGNTGNNSNVATSVELNVEELSLVVKKSAQLQAAVVPAGTELVWSSSNASVVSVDATGKVTAKKPGVATITVQTKDGKSNATCEVTVKPAKVTGFKKVKVGTKSVKLKWNKQSNVKGYKIYMYNTKTKKYKVVVTINNKNTKSATIKGLKKNTKYQFKIVSFTKNAGEVIASSSSKVVKVKTLK